MATSTTNLGLTKPAGTDKIRIAQINGNMDILDEKIGAVGNTSLQAQVTSQNEAITTLNSKITYVWTENYTYRAVSALIEALATGSLAKLNERSIDYCLINGSMTNGNSFSGYAMKKNSTYSYGVITYGNTPYSFINNNGTATIQEVALKSDVATKTSYTPTVESNRITYDSSSSVASKNGILCCNIRFSVNTAISTSPTVLGDIGVSLPHQMQFAGIKGDNTVVRLLVTANGGLLTYSPLVSGDVVFLSFSMILNG